MANKQGKIDLLPEQFANATAWLPTGVTIVSSAQHGSSRRAVIEGAKLKSDRNYQLVIINEPLRRIIELVESPAEDA